MNHDLAFAAARSQGARDYQEDDFRLVDLAGAAGLQGGGLLMILADGMGGHAAGATASALSVDAFATSFTAAAEATIADRLLAALTAANDALARHLEDQPEADGMGCTLVGLALTRDGIEWVSVGDSPLWRLRAGDLERLNADHSMAPVIDMQMRRGQMSARMAAQHPQRNALRSAVMGDEIELVDVAEAPLSLAAGDRLVLASDGVETLEPSDIAARAGADGTDAQAIADDIIAAVDAAEAQHQDNATVLVALVG